MFVAGWTIHTPGGEYCPKVTIFASRLGAEEVEQGRRIWFFASSDLRQLDPEAVKSACDLYAEVSGQRYRYLPERMDYSQAEQLADELAWAVSCGHIRFEKIRAPFLGGVHQAETPVQAQAVAAEALDFIEVSLVDDSGSPVAGVRYELKLPDGRVITGLTDVQGKAWAPKMPSGSCELTFPRLDEDAWEAA